MNNQAVTVDDIARAILGFRFIYSNERELQLGIARALKARGIEFEPEKDLGGGLGVVDFVVGRIAIEVKIKGSPSAVARQLRRYTECADVDEIILVTGRASLGALPERLGGKELHVLSIWSTMLCGGEGWKRRRRRSVAPSGPRTETGPSGPPAAGPSPATS